jgi:predicted HicB family RNase H-like nuclease
MQPKRLRVKTADLNIRITPELKEAARKAAARDQRTLSGLIEKLLTDYCREHGLLKPGRKT